MLCSHPGSLRGAWWGVLGIPHGNRHSKQGKQPQSPSSTQHPEPQCHPWALTPWHGTQKSPNHSAVQPESSPVLLCSRARESYELFMVKREIRSTGDPLLLETEP